MQESKWDVLHGGYGATYMVANANYGVPVDVVREMEKAGIFKKLYSYFYGTTGVEGMVSAMKAIGKGKT